jgi:hypothetical protein
MTEAIARVSYTHEDMINTIIAQPWISQKELAARYGYTQGWISQVINSDAFRERLAERKDSVVDPVLRMSLEERIRGVTDVAVQMLAEKLSEAKEMPGLGGINAAIRVLEHGSRALGYGAQNLKPNVVVQNYVAVVPQKSLSSEAWVESHKPAPRSEEFRMGVGMGEGAPVPRSVEFRAEADAEAGAEESEARSRPEAREARRAWEAAREIEAMRNEE